MDIKLSPVVHFVLFCKREDIKSDDNVVRIYQPSLTLTELAYRITDNRDCPRLISKPLGHGIALGVEMIVEPRILGKVRKVPTAIGVRCITLKMPCQRQDMFILQDQ